MTEEQDALIMEFPFLLLGTLLDGYAWLDYSKTVQQLIDADLLTLLLPQGAKQEDWFTAPYQRVRVYPTATLRSFREYIENVAGTRHARIT